MSGPGGLRAGATVASRILAIMGSGETAPTMAKVHRELFGRLGPPPVPAVILDTPYGFQENADEISERALEYFRDNIGYPMTLATFRSQGADALVRATAVARAGAAHYLFAGPGSPSYALAQWRGTELPSIVADKLRYGGIVTFASAAALTLGSHTLPVYEIYKAGEPPRWLDGLDLLAAHGLPVAVIPHYDNAEGGTHDTRFCYLGERRLAMLESMLPAGHFVLGVDSHTALVLDFVEAIATVMGIGSMTIRADGHSEVFPSGSIVPIGALAETAERLRAGGQGTPRELGHAPGPGATGQGSGNARSTPLDDQIRYLEARFDERLAAGQVTEAVGSILAMDQTLLDWSRDSDGTDDLDRARSVFRSLVVRLGERVAQAGQGSADERLGPLVELLIDLRGRARVSREFQQADVIRDTLTAAGIELRDGVDGTTWGVRQDA